MKCLSWTFYRVQVRDREIKVNIFDMAGHPFFYEVSELVSHYAFLTARARHQSLRLLMRGFQVT